VPEMRTSWFCNVSSGSGEGATRTYGHGVRNCAYYGEYCLSTCGNPLDAGVWRVVGRFRGDGIESQACA
jgi:hypothetical protein